MTLEGGIKGWVKAGPQYTRLMDGYKEDYWQELFAEEEKKAGETAQGQEEKRQAGEGDVVQ